MTSLRGVLTVDRAAEYEKSSRDQDAPDDAVVCFIDKTGIRVARAVDNRRPRIDEIENVLPSQPRQMGNLRYGPLEQYRNS